MCILTLSGKVYIKMKYKLYDLQEDVRKCLKEKRFIHSLGVMYTAQALAMRYNISIEDAGAAGILHDLAKEMKDDELLKYCRKNNIYITEDEKNSPYLLHGRVGAHIASEKYHIKNNDILDAIIYHTTGKPAMTTLGKIIYIADFIEPGRKMFDVLPEIRKHAFVDLDKTCALILKYTIDYISGKDDKYLDGNSELAFEFYKEYLED